MLHEQTGQKINIYIYISGWYLLRLGYNKDLCFLKIKLFINKLSFKSHDVQASQHIEEYINPKRLPKIFRIATTK